MDAQSKPGRLAPQDWPEHDPEAIRALDQRLAELRAQGIISGGEGPRGSLKPIAHRPGALARFLAERRGQVNA